MKNNSFRFSISKKDKKTKARLGIIITPHGEIETPAFVPVATQATVKSLTPAELHDIGVNIILCNTYHLYLSPKASVINEMGGLHKFMNWNKPIITDSGGFQVFSLGLSKKNYNNGEKLMTKINREKSAREIGMMSFPGYAIGGVAVGEGKKEMYDAVSRAVPILPEEKPKHLLGVGEIDDFFNCIKWGIDTFDCVIPTRLGRMGHFFTKNKKIWENKKWQANITKAKFSDKKEPLDDNCHCYSCQNFNMAYINHLFRNEELLGYRLLTFHNIFFLTRLLSNIRVAIANDEFDILSKHWIK